VTESDAESVADADGDSETEAVGVGVAALEIVAVLDVEVVTELEGETVLTWTLGFSAAAALEAEDAPRVAEAAAAEGRAADAGFSAELEALLRGERAAAEAEAAAAPPVPPPLQPPGLARSGSSGWGVALAADDGLAAAAAEADAEAPVMASIAGGERRRQAALPLLKKTRSQVW
jgi:hypothetical protein